MQFGNRTRLGGALRWSASFRSQFQHESQRGFDEQNAYNNFVNFTGYQPPQNSITADSLIAKNLIPPNLRTAIISPGDFGPTSLQECQLTNRGSKLWLDA